MPSRYAAKKPYQLLGDGSSAETQVNRAIPVQNPKRTRTSESTSESPQSPTKLAILNTGRAGYAKLGVTYNEDEPEPSGSSSRGRGMTYLPLDDEPLAKEPWKETVASDPYSDHNNETPSNDYSMTDDPSNHGASTSMHPGLAP
ncbi:MAG: hypothetical protein Q9223_006752 [Gallowayella weberi]